MTNQDIIAAIRLKNTDKSTSRGATRKRNAEDSSFKSRTKGTRTGRFEGRCKQLIDFRDEFGHCHVPCKFSVDTSFGTWCRTMTEAYSKIQKGQTSRSKLTQDQIERLEEISNGNLVIKTKRHLSNAFMILKHSRASLGIVMFLQGTH